METHASTTVALAFGARQLPKLVEALELPAEALPQPERARALALLLGGLAAPEAKVQAVQAGALPPLLTWLAHPASSDGVARAACACIASIAALRQGRAALADAGGVAVLTAALATVPDSAAAALRVLASSADGAAALRASPVAVTAALVGLAGAPGSTHAAAADACACLADLCRGDEGACLEALACEAPACLAALAGRALRHGSAPAGGTGPGLLHGAVRALLSIAQHGGPGRAHLREAGCIAVLARALGSPDGAAQSVAAACLAALSIDADSKLPVMVEAGPALIALLRGGPR
ncbi:hypothetical protein HT031_002519 [Scenedesmus sp. PABB004]|nr:hypothetical protein HT031_002519 [Scenedesmus sp. PABB004]